MKTDETIDFAEGYWIVQDCLWGKYRVEKAESKTEMPQLAPVVDGDGFEEARPRTGPLRIGPFASKDELDRAMEDLRGDPTFAVYMSNSTGELYVKKVDNLSGNWRAGDFEGFGMLVEAVGSEKEAMDFIRRQREDCQKTLASRGTRP